MMTRYFITTVFLLFLVTNVFAQTERRAILHSTKPGLTIHVIELAEEGDLKLQGVEVMLVTRKDTVNMMKTDVNGEVYYRGPFRAPIVEIIVSHPGYETQITERKAPSTPTMSSRRHIYMKRKQDNEQGL